TFSCQTQPSGQCFGPALIRAAYGIDKVKADGAGRTIVIVDAFQSPTIQHDLALFDQVFELPDPVFTSRSACSFSSAACSGSSRSISRWRSE
ncbi:MAG TPA: hypothetical protein VLM05_03740, partial [Mycobacteriales bacterium]|nr:hypothetical protein [Mycobacteriales bacterium]